MEQRVIPITILVHLGYVVVRDSRVLSLGICSHRNDQQSKEPYYEYPLPCVCSLSHISFRPHTFESSTKRPARNKSHAKNSQKTCAPSAAPHKNKLRLP